jgi:choline kinase
VSSFYDPSFELEVFKGLSDLQIGPKMIANGDQWRIEEYHESVVLKCSSLPNPSIYTQIASQLGRLHKIHRLPSFLSQTAPGPARSTPISYDRLENWTREGVIAIDKLLIAEMKKSVLRIDEILVEIETTKKKLHANSKSNRLGYDVVFCHNDVQENNVLLTPYGLRLIDFEYANFNFQSADIGNFFNEFTMDYVHGEWPFFKTDPSAYPSPEVQRMFASVYLSEYFDRPIMESQHAVMIDEFLESVHVFSQLSHLLWGMWSLVRAQQNSETFNSFDFVEYAIFRFDSYWQRKRSCD